MTDITILDSEPTPYSQDADKYALRCVQVMDEWGNGEVFDERALIERGRMAAQYAAASIYELGRVLIILKELVEHGRFTQIIENDFRITKRSAQRYMLSVSRFQTAEMKRVQDKLTNLGQTKLLVLFAEATDDELVEFADGGQISGFDYDEADRMTRDELRSALKKSREETETARAVSDEKNRKIDDLAEQLEQARRKTKKIAPVDVAEEIKQTMNAHEAAALSQIYLMRAICEQLIEHGQIHNMDHTPAMVGSINQIIRACESLRETFHLPREAPTDEIPAWLKDEG